jgi:acyl-CoA synthetase (AMP-forming)/AMP-acid ligase II
LTTLPIFLLSNLASGVTSLIPNADLRFPGAIDPARVAVQIGRHHPASCTASPAFFERLVRHARDRGFTMPHFRKLFTGGAPVFPRLLNQMRDVAPHAVVVSVYGSTEAEPMAHIALQEIHEADHKAMQEGKGLLAGIPIDGLQLRIIRDCWGRALQPMTEDEFDGISMPEGEPGEIVVYGEHVLKGYLHGRGEEETKFRVASETWHRTGDAGYLDTKGRLWLLGRCVARVEDEHGVLYPFAVEVTATTDPRIRRAALIARKGRRTLVIELYDNNSPYDIDTLRRQLAWAHISEVRVCAHIPVDKRHNAKIDYTAMHKLMERLE